MAHSFLIVDDSALSRRLIRNLLAVNLEETFSCWEAADGADAIEKIRALDPDVVILDINMPRLNGLEVARQVVESGSRTAVLITSIYDATALLPYIQQQGIRGFISKSSLDLHFMPAVRALLRGKTYFEAEADATSGQPLPSLPPVLADGSSSFHFTESKSARKPSRSRSQP